MSRLVLVTREIEQAKDFSAQIQAIGGVPVIQPLLDIDYFPVDFKKIAKPHAIVLSSPQAMRGREFPILWADVPVFCVGLKTEMVARDAGAKICITGRDGIDDILPMIRKKIPAGQTILYVCGEHIRRHLPHALPQHHVQSIVTYCANTVEGLSQETIDCFYRLHTITLFSPRTGLILKQFMGKYDLNHFAVTINLLCLSSSVLESVKDMGWKSCYVAGEPTQSGMIDKLKMICKSN